MRTVTLLFVACFACVFGPGAYGQPAPPAYAALGPVIKTDDGYPSETPITYDVKFLDFNFSGMDFSPVPYKEGLVFVSSRAKKGANEGEASFLTLYYTEEQEDGSFLKPIPFNAANISAYHEGPAAFYQDGTRQIITRNAFMKRTRSKDGDPDPLELAYSERSEGGKWSTPVAIPLAPPGYSVAHPTINESGTLLFFSSDMPGTTGQSDIFFSRLVNNKWTSPENLGSSVNTPGQELFPFLSKDSVLYFSSNGHSGKGGLDLFYIDLKAKLRRVQHLPEPLNSTSDDFGIYLEENGASGFFSSGRNGGAGGDDIYYFEERQTFAHLQFYDSITRAPAQYIRVLLQDGSGNSVTRKSDLAGNLQTRLRLSQTYSLSVADENYESKTIRLDPAKHLSQRSAHRVYLKPRVWNDERAISAGLSSRDRQNITNVISFSSGPLDVDVVSESEGNSSSSEDELTESEKPALHLIVVEIVNELPAVYITQGDSIYQFEKVSSTQIQNRLFDLRLEIPQGAKRQVYEPIMREQLLVHGYEIKGFMLIRSFFFDSGKSWVRNDASAQLDKIIEVLVNHPRLHIEMTFHADARGTDRFNLDLSKQRAEEVAAYFVKAGIDRNRFVARFVGESQLLNDCGDLADCDELLHQINRTAEFRLILH